MGSWKENFFLLFSTAIKFIGALDISKWCTSIQAKMEKLGSQHQCTCLKGLLCQTFHQSCQSKSKNKKNYLKYFCFADQIAYISIVHICNANSVFIAQLWEYRAFQISVVELIFEYVGNVLLKCSGNSFHEQWNSGDFDRSLFVLCLFLYLYSFLTGKWWDLHRKR